MDRISALWPQIGWSPLMAPPTTKVSPASRVEAAGAGSQMGSGLRADVDTPESGDRAQTARLIGALSAARHNRTDPPGYGGAVPEASPRPTPKSRPDPDALVGPKPTFEVSPLEAAAARALDPPAPLPQSNEIDQAPVEASAPAAPKETENLQDDAPERPQVTADETPAMAERAWRQLSDSGTAQLDVTR
ncbi:hypothetical protein DL1_13770 [Thioclava dalianensis]|uniref:Uncharacterized protein n=1 Tax=Thioclava dalianensis TaxID=1185766 RepID=A0A074TLA0_9RHOB|nr:hypothetical protein [Thioclava dalianensis]KEP70965.1 hypothetical protein DL1_13770 [Thioclava dalianensis]